MESASDSLKLLTARAKKIFWNLGLHAFSLILLLILVDFVLCGFVFYYYVFLAEQEMPKVSENIIQFNSKTYKNVLQELQAREQGNNQLSIPVSTPAPVPAADVTAIGQ